MKGLTDIVFFLFILYLRGLYVCIIFFRVAISSPTIAKGWKRRVCLFLPWYGTDRYTPAREV